MCPQNYFKTFVFLEFSYDWLRQAGGTIFCAHVTPSVWQTPVTPFRSHDSPHRPQDVGTHWAQHSPSTCWYSPSGQESGFGRQSMEIVNSSKKPVSVLQTFVEP